MSLARLRTVVLLLLFVFTIAACSSVTTTPDDAPVDTIEEPSGPDAPAPGDPDAEEPGDLEEPVDANEPGDETADELSSARLTYRPPTLSNPIRIRVHPTNGPFTISMNTSRDYVIEMPTRPVRRAMSLQGGRNVVMIGGEISIPHQGSSPSINSRRALYIANATGTVHIEGVLMRGDDISEGVQIRAPRAIVQLQNVGIFNVHARDQRTFKDNHPDIVQTWGGVKELRIDRLTGDTDYQGLLFKADFNGPHGPVHIHNTNIIGKPTARYLIWMSNQGGGYPRVTFNNVWVDVPTQRSGGLGKALWPDVNASSPWRLSVNTSGGAQSATWSGTSRITGSVRRGRPPGGNFVSASSIGIGYRSPGYR